MSRFGVPGFSFLAVSAAIFLSGCSLLQGDLAVQLTADVDRNGIVEAAKDDEGEDAWTMRRGALMLNNCDSDADNGEPDHADTIVNGDADVEDLAVVRARRLAGLSSSQRATLSVDDAALPHVNAFRRTSEGTFEWIDLRAKGNVPNDALRRANVEFLVEAKSFATGGWNGEARLTLTIDRPDKAGAPVFKDTVVLRSAPWIMLSNLDRADVLYVREFPERNDAMLEQLRALMPDIEAQLHVVPGDAPYPPNNIWMQDTMEIGFTQKTPDTRMSAVLKANRDKGLDAFAKDGLLGPDFGWFTCGEFRPQFGAGDGGTSWMDWFGNLEVTPALDDYPYGRVYYGMAGEDKSLNPDVVALIDAQGIQDPALPIDVSFLLIKHADELICFLPSGNPESPYKVLVPDVRLMLELATEWEESGYGNIAMLTNFRDGMTVRGFLADAGLRSHNMRIQEQHLDPLYEQLKSEFGLQDDDLIHIPAYYERDGRSMIPNMVNSAYANGFLLVPQPNGPVFGHYDLLEDDFRERLAGLPLEVHFLDDRQYHKWCGNVHCATNAKRESARRVWWE